LGGLLKQYSTPTLPPLVESRRLSVLHSYDILDTPREAAFDDIARIASMVCGTPRASITLIDAERQWFKSEIGMGGSETLINASICVHVMLEHDVLIIPDISVDARFANNPLFTDDPGLKFYAGAPITTADGVSLGTVCVVDTVTRILTPEQIDTLRMLARQVMLLLELRKMLKNSERSSDYRAHLLANAAHELRQPLFVASLSVQSLLPDAAPQQIKRLKLADGGMETIKNGLNRMLIAASVRATFTLANFADTNLGDILEYISANFAPAAEHKEIRFRVMRTRLKVISDAAKLETLVGNLVANAVKYTEAGGRVVIGCRRHSDHVALHIIDTGIGMANEAIDALFEAFRQGEARSGGHGLGLWIVKRTAEALGITVQVRSILGQGTHFTLRIPALPSPDVSDEPAIQIV